MFSNFACFVQLDEFANICDEQLSQKGTVVGPEVIAELRNSLKSGSKPIRYDCTYAEVISLALECSATSTSDILSTSFCASVCAKKLFPFVRQCAETTGAALKAVGLSNTVSMMLDACDQTEMDPSTCPVEEIVADCSNIEAVLSSMDDICHTPCAQAYVNHYDACIRSDNADAKRIFSDQSWAQLLSSCRMHALTAEDESAGANPPSWP